MALGRMGTAAEPAMTALCEATTDPDPDVRFWAVKALAETGALADVALGYVIRASRDEDADVRWQVVLALRKSGERNASKRTLRELLADVHFSVRTEAEAALADWQ